MTKLLNDDFRRRIGALALGAFGGLSLGYVISSPTSLAVTVLLYGGIAVSLAMALPPHVFLPTALLLVGVSTAFSTAVLSVGSTAFFVIDLGVLIIVLRGLIPRNRYRGPRSLVGIPQTLFFIWLFVMSLAGIRAHFAGLPNGSVIRSDLALFYWPLLYFGFTRVLAETGLNTRLLWRNLALVGVGFVVYMFIARAFNHTFQDPGLALVSTGPNESIPRNYGFASAFIIYPVLAIAAVALLANTRGRTTRWALLAALGVIATLTTLIRGEIFSLSVGVLIVLLLSPPQALATGRVGAILRLSVVAGLAILAVLAVNPRLGSAVVQRTLPFTRQAADAKATADYRLKAIRAGVREAREHPFGIGVLDEGALIGRNIDPGYVAHSGSTTLLIFGGWLALGAAVLSILAAVRRSFQAPSTARWLHPAFVGAIIMLGLYSLGAEGLAGDSWVIPLGALVLALRFGFPVQTAQEDHP